MVEKIKKRKMGQFGFTCQFKDVAGPLFILRLASFGLQNFSQR